jgi:hypothetical protein
MTKRNPFIYVAIPLIVFIGIMMLLVGCSIPTDYAPAPDSDSSQNFTGGEVPVDDSVYLITGQVITDVDSLTRQTKSSSGSVSGIATGEFGYLSGTYYGAEFGGKGFIRVKVLESNSFLAPVGEIVILKSTDTKGIALLPGDVVNFKCRHQYESVAAVRNRETFNAEKLETWEIDYCRFTTPIISQLILPIEQ